jgi:hypothetical protein
MAKKTRKSTIAQPDNRVENARSPMNGVANASALDEEHIRVRAYHRYLERGGADGGALDDWIAAERDLAPPANSDGKE